MKKSIAIVIIVTLVISLIAAMPVFAKSENPGGRKVFEGEVVATCMGSTLEKGEIFFRANDSYQVELKGAGPTDKTYDFIYFGVWPMM